MFLTDCFGFKSRQYNYPEEELWLRGYRVSTVGLDEDMEWEYIRIQEKEDAYGDQLKFGM